MFTKPENKKKPNHNHNSMAAIAAGSILAAAMMLAIPLIVSQEAAAAANKSVSGRGTGDITCLNGPLPAGETATIQFSATKSKGVMSGSFSIIAATGAKFGSINGGSVGANSFTLTGIESTDTACLGPVPISFTIHGECGTAVPIHFESETQRGEFVGNVAC